MKSRLDRLADKMVEGAWLSHSELRYLMTQRTRLSIGDQRQLHARCKRAGLVQSARTRRRMQTEGRTRE